MSTKVLITGSSGLLGRAVFDCFSKQKEFETSGLVYSRTNYKNRLVCDLTCEKNTLEVLNLVGPSMIVHCAAERRPDVVNKDKENANKLNVGSIVTITEWCKANNSHLIFISTDYVFDGNSPPYKEDDEVSPINDYGVLKAAAEKIVLESGNILLRLPVLYGKVEFVEESAVTVIFSAVKDNTKKAPMSNFERRYPTDCDDVSQTILNMVKYWTLGQKSLSGAYHYQSEEEMTKYDMAIKMAYIFSLPATHIEASEPPDGTEVVKRPFKSQMSCEKLKSLGLYHQPRPFSVGIAACLTSFVN